MEKVMKEMIGDTNEVSHIDLWKLLDKSRFTIARLRGIELAQFGLTIEQSSILQTLLENGGSLTTKELEEETMRQPNSISILVKRMVKMGLLRRERSKTRQRHRIYLTQDGEDLIKKVTLVSIEMPFTSFTAEEKQQISKFLSKLLNNARELLGIPNHPPFLKYLAGKTKAEDPESE
jgi:DNA-binding MarR family transcriptional regulator